MAGYGTDTSRVRDPRRPALGGLNDMAFIGLISDTHGLLRPEALAALKGADLILHAGDIGDPGILEALGGIAPVTAVRGNCDVGAWTEKLRDTEVTEFEGVTLYILHDLSALDLSPGTSGFRVVVSGHTHKHAVEERAGVLYVNPGSAGPRRFSLPVSIAHLQLKDGTPRCEIVELKV